MTNSKNDSDKNSNSILYMILNEMNPFVKGFVFTVLSIPVVIALSGMLLQVNVGKIIETALDKQASYQIQIQREEADRVLKAINDSIIILTKDLMGVDERLASVEKTMIDTRTWICNYPTPNKSDVDKTVFCN